MCIRDSLMVLTQIVVDSDVDLLSIAGTFANAEQIVQSLVVSKESIAGHVEAVNTCAARGAPVIRRRHQINRACDESRCIEARAERIPRTVDHGIGTIGVRRAARERNRAVHADICLLYTSPS